MLKGILKWTGIAVGSLLGLLILTVATLYFLGSQKINRVYEVRPANLTIPTDSLAQARGRHIAETQGCFECHGKDLGGEVFSEGQPFGNIAAANLTSGAGGIGTTYQTEDWVKALRHGINRENRPLLIMPADAFAKLSDRDLSDLIAFVQNLPPVDRSFPERQVGFLPNIISNFNEQLLAAPRIDHSVTSIPEVVPAANVEYGRYLANLCMACHGENLKGGIVHGPPGTPASRNITNDPENGIGAWSESDFRKVLNEGIRPDGTELDPMMPRLGQKYSEQEMKALWLFLREVNPLDSQYAQK